VVCDATVAGWTLEGASGPGRVTALVACNAAGRTLTVRAAHVVIAAGAIESTRIVLEIHRIGGDAVLPPGAEAGQGLSDHLSTTIAEVEPQARARMADAFAPRFRRGTMRSLRWIVAAPAPDAPRAFAHPVFALDAPGFVFARAVLRDLQARRLPRPGMREFARGIGGVARLGWERYANTRLHVPADAPSHLQMDMEQRPHPCNRIRLGDARDRHGRPVAAIDWRIRDADRDDLATAAAGLLARWHAAGDAVPPLQAVAADAIAAKPHDAYHPVGSCRMGGDAGAVVDLGLRLRGLDNVRVLSTAVLPGAGSANPTFALLCLADEVAVALQSELRGALGAVA
jgi:choline dehydrogenase-like flavoprotein